MTTRNWKELKKTPRQLKAEEAGRKIAAELTEPEPANPLEEAMQVAEAVEAAPATAEIKVGETLTEVPAEAPEVSVEFLNNIAFATGGVVENTEPVIVGEQVSDHVLPKAVTERFSFLTSDEAKARLETMWPQLTPALETAARTHVQSNTLQVLKLDDSAKLPTVAHPGEDLGYDIYANETVVFSPNETRLVSTGIVAFQEGHGLLIRDRSSMALKGFTVSAGVIDAGYRGELKVLITNNRFDIYAMQAGDKIAQMIPLPVLTGEVIEVTELPEGARGDKGYGSSGR